MTAAASHLNLDSSGHPDPETIADYLEDLLTPQAAAELDAHLADCADCRESRDALDEIRSLLGETETPPIPDDIALRIDAALAAEAQAQRPAVPTEPATTLDKPAQRTAGGFVLPSAAAAPSGPTGPTRPAGPAGRGPGHRTGRRLRRAALGLAGLAACGLIVTAALDLHGSGGQSASSSSAAQGSAGLSPATAPRSTVFSAAGFTQQIQTLLRTAPSQGSQPQLQSGGQQPNSASAKAGEQTAPPAVPECVLHAVDRPDQQPLTTSRGSYQGSAVYALVYPDRTDPAHTVDAYLVTTDCTVPSGGTTPVLLHRTVPRP